MVTAPVRREVVREMVARSLSERRALAVGRMSASAFRYVPRPDGNAVVRDRIVDLAQQHRRYGAGMIYLKLREAGHVINHKRVDRLDTEARLQLKRRRRKKIPRADSQPLVRPETSPRVRQQHLQPSAPTDTSSAIVPHVAARPRRVCCWSSSLRPSNDTNPAVAAHSGRSRVRGDQFSNSG